MTKFSAFSSSLDSIWTVEAVMNENWVFFRLMSTLISCKFSSNWFKIILPPSFQVAQNMCTWPFMWRNISIYYEKYMYLYSVIYQQPCRSLNFWNVKRHDNLTISHVISQILHLDIYLMPRNWNWLMFYLLIYLTHSYFNYKRLYIFFILYNGNSNYN